MAQQQRCLDILSATRYFTPERWAEVYVPLFRERRISLRVLDFTVSVYARERGVVICPPDGGEVIVVYSVAQNWLHALKKKTFDAFRRHGAEGASGDFVFGHGDMAIETTVGQLHFLWFLHAHHILPYVEAHLADITEALREYERQKRQEKLDAYRSRVAGVQKRPRRRAKARRSFSSLSFGAVRSTFRLGAAAAAVP